MTEQGVYISKQIRSMPPDASLADLLPSISENDHVFSPGIKNYSYLLQLWFFSEEFNDVQQEFVFFSEDNPTKENNT